MYAVSIQWGKGFHYFVETGISYEDAKRVYESAEYKLKAQRKRIPRGARPAVHLWCLTQSVKLA